MDATETKDQMIYVGEYAFSPEAFALLQKAVAEVQQQEDTQ